MQSVISRVTGPWVWGVLIGYLIKSCVSEWAILHQYTNNLLAPKCVALLSEKLMPSGKTS